MGYRVYISLARGHAQTQLLYRFVDRTSSARSLTEVLEIVLTEAAHLMHAELAFLVEVVDEQQVRYHAVTEGVLSVEDVDLHGPDAWWWATLGTGVVRYELGSAPLESQRDAVASTLMPTPRDGLAAQLRGSGQGRFVLAVCNRSFEKETFGTEDVQAFEALAAHAGVALERARSVSDLQSLAEELKVARDAALAASEAKSLFLANMSHEIRTPLTTVLATAEILEDTPLDDLQLNLLEKMRRQGESLKTLVEAILDFSRIEAGQLELTSKPFDLHAMLADLTEVYDPRANRAGIRFEKHLHARVAQMVIGDPGRLSQVLTNLLDNALKFTHQGQVDLLVRPIKDDDEVGSEGVEFVVRDTGIGIGIDDQPSIFEVFSQVDPTATRRYEGTGLGLAICKQLTGLMGGTIEVEAQLGVGSTFTVQLPLVAAPLPQRPSANSLAGSAIAPSAQPARR